MKKSNTKFTWSSATQDKLVTIQDIISCHRAGHRPLVEKRDNKDLEKFEFPLTILNPELDDWRNYTMSYGVPTNSVVYAQILNIKNPTERDLTENYTSYFFSSEKERDAYLNEGKLPEKFSNCGYCAPMKKSDFFKLRPDLVKAGWTNEQLWTTFWRATVPYWVNIDCEVYSVKFDDQEAMSEEELEKFLADFIMGKFD